MNNFSVSFEHDDEQVYAVWSTLYGQGDDEIEALKDLRQNMFETFCDLREVYTTDHHLNPALAQLYKQLQKVFDK